VLWGGLTAGEGWTLTDGEWWRICESGQRRRVPAEWIGSSGLDLEIVVRATNHNDNLALLPFRLGLCAAAESLLEEARVVNESIARGGPVVDEYDERVGSMRFVVSHMTTADSILALAGISADAWESARKR
jgi:hypothetical protein